MKSYRYSNLKRIIVFVLAVSMLPFNYYATFAADDNNGNIIIVDTDDLDENLNDEDVYNNISTVVINEENLDNGKGEAPKEEPLSPAFNNSGDKTNSSEFKGLRPSPVKINTNFDLLKEDRTIYPMMFMARSVSLDQSNYDLRNLGRLSSVKDQGPNGSCWAFATYSSAESVLLPKESLDFSEKSLRNNHGFDWSPDEGGNLSMATAYLARWSGPVLEKDDPYDIYGYTSPKNLPRAKDLNKVIYYPSKKDALSNQNIIKKAIMDYGAVYSPISYDNYFLNKRTFAHYDTRSANPNHAVTIVGWDDNYNRRNFLTLPPRNGAWLVKNSFGTKWGMGGFYWVSYYDKQIANDTAVFVMGDIVPYQKIYQYDELGFSTSIGYGETGYFANQFGPLEEDEYLTDVGFYAPSNSAEYEVYLVDDTGKKGLADGTRVASGMLDYAGYYKLPVERTKMKKGSKFAVVVKLTTPKHKYPIAIEKNIRSYSSKATANDGEGFISKDGVNYTDLNKQIKNASVCLKAFTIPSDKINKDDENAVKVKTLEITPRMVKMNIDEEFVPNVRIMPADATNKDLKWQSSDNTIVEVVDGKLHAVGYGEATISATTTDNSYISDSIRVLVSDEGVKYKASILSQRTTYVQGENAIFDIRLRDQNERTLPNKEMEIVIITPHNTKISCNVTTDASGTATMRSQFDKMAPIGKYTIKAIYKGEVVGINLISVKSAKFEPDLSNPVIITHDILNTRIRTNTEFAFTANLKDKHERIIRYGTCEAVLYDGDVELAKLSKYTDRRGNASFKFGGNLFSHEGNYKLVIKGSYGSMDRIPVSVDLIADDNAPDVRKLSIDVKSDKANYFAGKENARISVVVKDDTNKPISYADLKIKATDPEGREYNAKLKTNDKGLAKFNINLSTNARPGEFTIEVEATKNGYLEASGKTNFIVKKDGKYLVAKLSSRKKQYSINEQAYITLNVTDNENSPVRVADVVFTISGPGGTKTELRKRTDYYGQATMFITPNSYTSEGDYVIEAFVSCEDFPSTSTTLAVRFGESVYEGQSLIVTVRNEKDVFYDTETPKVNFLIENQNNVSVPNASINLTIVSPDGQKSVEQVYADDYGKATWVLKKHPVVGVYEIRSEVSKIGYESNVASTKFEVVPLPVTPVIHLNAGFDKEVYEKGDTITLKINAVDNDKNPVKDANVLITSIENPDEKFKLTTNETGSAVFEYKNTERIGKYEFNVSVTKENHISTEKNYAVFVKDKEADVPDESVVFKEVSAAEAFDLYNSKGVKVLDLRSKAEYIDERVQNSVNYDKNDKYFEQFIKSLSKNTGYIVMLSDEMGVDDVVQKLKAENFKEIYILRGGFKSWKEAGNPTVATTEKRDININLTANADAVKKGDKLILNLDAVDRYGNYLKNLDANIKIQDKIGNNFINKNIVFDELGKYVFEFEIEPTLRYGSYKFIIEAKKPKYEEGSNAFIFEIGSKTSLISNKSFEDADKLNKFSHLKDKDFARKYYGKNVLSEKIFDSKNKLKYVYSDLDIENPTFILYFDNLAGIENLKKFASVEHIGYNFIAVSADDDNIANNIKNTTKLIENEKISRVKSSVFFNNDTEKIGKVLMLDKFGNVVNVFEDVDLIEIKGIAKRDLNLEFSTNYVDPDEEANDKLEAIITVETSKEVYNRGDVVDIFVEMKDAVTKKPISNRNIKYTLRDPKGRVATYMRQTNDIGRHRLRVAVGEKGTIGDYKVFVELLDSRYPNAGAMTGYTVSDGTSVNKKNMKPELKMEKPVKMQGEDYRFRLKTKDVEGNIVAFANLTLSIKNLTGDIERSYQFMTNDNGQIESSFKVPTTLKPGKYILNITIEASGYKKLSKEIDFEILKNPDIISDDDKPVVIKTVPMSFEEHDKRGDFGHLTDAQKKQIQSKFGTSLADKTVTNYDNENVEFSKYLDGNKPLIVLLGDHGRSESNKMWLDFIRNKSDDYNFVCAYVAGSNSQLHTFVEMWKFQNDSDKFITRGSVLNAVAPNTRPFIMYLDKYGKLVNIYPYQRFDEARNIFETTVKGTDAFVSEDDAKEKYVEVTFVADRNTVVKVLVGRKVNLPAEPVKEGYKFEGWFTDPEFKKAFDVNTLVKENMTLYAKFVKNPEPEKPVEPKPDEPVEPKPDEPVEPKPDEPVVPKPDEPVVPKPDEPVVPKPDEPKDDFKIDLPKLVTDPFELKVKDFAAMKANGEICNLSDDDLNTLERKFGTAYGYLALYNDSLVRVSEFENKGKSTIMLIGEYKNQESIKMWKDGVEIDRDKFNVVLANSSNNYNEYNEIVADNQFAEQKGDFYRNGIVVKNQVTRSKEPYIVALDREGKLINAAPYTRDNLNLILNSAINSLAARETLAETGKPITLGMLGDANLLDTMDDRMKNIFDSRFGTDWGNYVLFGLDNKSTRLKDLTAGDEQKIIVFGEGKVLNANEFIEAEDALRDFHSFYAISTGGQRELSLMSLFGGASAIRNRLYRNGVAPMVKNLFSAKSFIILDKNNKLIYASPYRDAKEIFEIACKLKNAYVIK